MKQVCVLNVLVFNESIHVMKLHIITHTQMNAYETDEI